jgi:hypothetical protein
MTLAEVSAADTAIGTESSEDLTSEEARRRSEQFGPNSMPDTSSHPARMAIEKLWAPSDWMDRYAHRGQFRIRFIPQISWSLQAFFPRTNTNW